MTSGLADRLDRQDRLRTPADLGFERQGGAIIAAVRPASRGAGQSYATRIWRFGLDGTARQLTDGPGADELPRPSPVDDRIAFASDRASPGKLSLFLLEGGRARPLGAIPGTIEDIRWTADGRALVVLAADRGLDGGATNGAVRIWWGEPEDPAVTARERARRRLFRVAATDGATVEVGPADRTVWEFDLLGDGAAVALVSADPSERGWYHAEIARLDFAGRGVESLHGSRWQLQSAAADATGRRIAFVEGWSSDRGLVAGEIRVLDLATRRVETIAGQQLSNVTALQWRDNGSLWFAGWSGLGSVYGVVRLDGTIAWMTREDAAIGPSSFLAQIVPAPDGTGFAAIREAVGNPPEIVLKAGPDAAWRTLTALNGAVAEGDADYPEVRPVTWKGPGGLALEGIVLRPRGTRGPLPMVVDIHGGPTWASKLAYDPGFGLPYAAAGFAVFLPNYRGNAGWGQDFAKLNVGDPAGAEFEDILAGVEWCVAEGIAVGDRIGVTGASYGGYLTAWAVAASTRFRAGVMVSGICNHLSCHYSCNHDFSEFIVGGPLSEERFRKLALERSPLLRLAGPAAPTLMIHGAEDRCTPLGQAQEFYAALLEQGGMAELAVYPREGHGFQETAHRRDAWERAVAWFDRHLRQG
jgi:dipeptidyl aminopeptidase/acylaminoacyl peptidase